MDHKGFEQAELRTHNLSSKWDFKPASKSHCRKPVFLTELTRLFQKCRTSGSIYLTMKKYDGRTKPVPRKGNPDNFEPADNKCLLRATDGKKKISTVISSKEVNRFQMAYSNLLRAHMDGLKKKDKKNKSKKTKATQ
ncbi:signal recognition particle 14 kDa protein isoform X1 [Narcine bancroftii]|uniref:signal recognition particle 14 kDa protein isoform X1 n=1 Tax=Narcine bancroftii TaxID=1343680 RepID=UPI003832300B